MVAVSVFVNSPTYLQILFSFVSNKNRKIRNLENELEFLSNFYALQKVQFCQSHRDLAKQKCYIKLSPYLIPTSRPQNCSLLHSVLLNVQQCEIYSR